jgi:tetratricopeptide (TPR) repeat protein
MDVLCDTLKAVLPYGNLTFNLYLIAGGITEGMPQVERIQRMVSQYLKENRLTRVYIHFVHALYVGTAKDVDYYYQYYYQSWKRSSLGFDREGFMHQEVPRLMLLPVIVPENGTDPTALAGLLDLLKSAFFLPGLYVGEPESALIRDPVVAQKAEKIYAAFGDVQRIPEMVQRLYSEAIVEDLSADLESRTGSVNDPCPPGIIISAVEGKAYACLDAYCRNQPLIDYLKNPDVNSLMTRYSEFVQQDHGCLNCKETRVEALSRTPLNKEKAREAGALFFRFGSDRQQGGEYMRAIESFSNSLKLSPEAEAPAIHFRLGVCLMNIGDYDEALAAFRTAAPAHQDRHYFHFYTGLCYYGKGELAEAVERLGEAVQMKPPPEDLVRVLIYLASCYNDLGRYADAVTSLEEAKDWAGDMKEIYSILGFSYFRLHDYDKAVKNLQTAVEIDPESAIDYASLAANYREKGDFETAISMFEKALEIDAGLVHARTGLEELRNRL